MPTIKEMTYEGLCALPKNPQSTMAYIPFQIDASMYDPEYALSVGTLFPDLDKPFLKGSDHCD